MNGFREPKVVVYVEAGDFRSERADRMTGQPSGTLAKACLQHGISVTSGSDRCALMAPRDRMQRCVEFMDRAGIRYEIAT